jgi:hypothetical protein
VGRSNPAHLTKNFLGGKWRIVMQRFEIVSVIQRPVDTDTPGAVDLVMNHRFVSIPDGCIEKYMEGCKAYMTRHCNLYTVEYFEVESTDED